MNDAQTGEQLIAELLSDPVTFAEKGRAYALLQAYFGGLPVESLRPLLRSVNELVQRAAGFVASELGRQAQPLVDDVVPLLRSSDRHVQYYAMEVLVVCCKDEHAEKFLHLAKMLDSADDVLRGLAMRLVSRAEVSQFEASLRALGSADLSSESHKIGLRTLAAGDRVEAASVATMLKSEDPLVRRYGAIAAKRVMQRFPSLIATATASQDPELRKFCEDLIGAPDPNGN
jgi:hypothetical protein